MRYAVKPAALIKGNAKLDLMRKQHRAEHYLPVSFVKVRDISGQGELFLSPIFQTIK